MVQSIAATRCTGPSKRSSPASKKAFARPRRPRLKALLPSASIVGAWTTCVLLPTASRCREPFCYRDERTVATKDAADRIIPPFEIYQRTGAIPLRLNTVYQLLADPAAGIDPAAHGS